MTVTWNPDDKAANVVLSNGNLQADTNTSYVFHSVRATLGRNSGKYYFEVKFVDQGIGYNETAGVMTVDHVLATYIGDFTTGWGFQSNGRHYNSTIARTGSVWNNGGTVMFAVDMDLGYIWFGLNGVWENSGNPAAGTNPSFSNLSTSLLYPACTPYTTDSELTGHLAAGDMEYTIPTGFEAWDQDTIAVSPSYNVTIPQAQAAAGTFTITGIAVPSDADIAILCWHGYRSGVGSIIDIANFDGDTDMHFIEIASIDDSNNHETTTVYTLRYGQTGFPTRGAVNQTLTLSQNDTLNYDDAHAEVFFLSGTEIDATYLIGTQESNAENWQSLSLGTMAPNDMGFIVVSSYNTIDVTPVDSQQAEIYQGINTNLRFGAAWESGEDQPSMTGTGSYIGAIAFAIKALSSGGTTVQGAVVDGFDFSEAILKNATIQGVSVDGLNAGDSDENIASLISLILDGMEIGDNSSSVMNAVVQLQDGIQISDVTIATIINAGIIQGIISDGINLSEATSAIGNLISSLTDGMVISEVVSTLQIILAQINDGVVITEDVIGSILVGIISALATEGIAFGDTSDSTLNLQVICSDGMTTSDATVGIMRLIASVSDAMQISDVVVTYLPNGMVTISFTSRQAKITIAVRRPDAIIASRQPDIKFDSKN